MSRDAAAYLATEQHIRLLQTKRERLAEAQIEAERQYVMSVSREHQAGSVSWTELERTYHVVRDGGLPGWCQRWEESLPYTIRYIKTMAARTEIDKWSGTGMNVHLDPGRPPRGAYVVYILFDQDNHPVYTGSTQSFANRMSHHRRDKVRASWVAYRCDSRAHAYEVESRFLRQYKPPVNRQGARATA